MNKTKKISLISLGAALVLTPLAIYTVRKLRSGVNGGCCAGEKETDGRKHLFGGMRSRRGRRDVENLEA